MNRKVFSYMEIAGEIAIANVDCRHFYLAAVGIRSDGVLVKAANMASELPDRKLHAEYRLARKLNYGSIVYVARVRADTGQFGLAKPCPDCVKVLSSKKVKRVYYTIAHDEYGVLDLK
jgi:Cytidine and deoxycytidylate deaminase zinc-binding region